ncbi:head decoration protein [Paraburkholderia sp. UCT2]|nr:head decoration protein [Paraburkholderia sp. UCT2]
MRANASARAGFSSVPLQGITIMGAPTVPPLFENWHDGGFLVSEANGHRSRDGIVLTGGVYVMAGTILSRLALPPPPPPGSDARGDAGAASVVAGTPERENTGDGVLRITDPPRASSSPYGRYVCTFTSRNTFDVSGPDELGATAQQTGAPVVVGSLSFVIEQGAKRFAAGDTFAITFTAADPSDIGTPGIWMPWNPAATDGSEVVAGLLFGSRDTTRMDRAAVAIVRDAEVNASELVWPSDVTPYQMQIAGDQLRAAGILLR